MDGKGLGQIFLAEVKRCLAESWFLDIWEPPGGFRLEAFTCFVMFKLELAPLGGFPGGGPRIWADGFIRSSHRRIQLPRFRPTSMSLSCMLWWTLSATSNTACVRLVTEKITYYNLENKEKRYKGLKKVFSSPNPCNYNSSKHLYIQDCAVL